MTCQRCAQQMVEVKYLYLTALCLCIDLPPFLGKLRSPFLQENSRAEASISHVSPAAQDVHLPSDVHPTVHDVPPVSPAAECGKAL